MTTIEILEEQVKSLSEDDLTEFRRWFLDWDNDEWDRQIERDATAGKLDALASAALAEYNAGQPREI
ncbi:MAG: hypothetical protein N838_33045 [Thiohalocapsa sp. PB-PSB1]|jgi:hypothetical protein|nr:MAG: hypothetical protein N838_30350 [Thiohalocapsa sp. PB-PSB1]QQO53886.1 MAG: hypothetical protein N838_11485 [Thiohalocapsa sp. PB-PSB1]QQO57463.1 MAG: hypothetical protein N838_33045 [Thiohalocapsa sp. PB-PSB1]